MTFGSMSGNSIYRHHVEPRVKLYSPRVESFPVPLKYIDVSRTTHTNLDVKQQKRIDDHCVGQAIVQGDEGPVSGVAQGVEDHGVSVRHEEEKEEEEVEQELEGEKEENAQTTMRMSMDGMTMEDKCERLEPM